MPKLIPWNPDFATIWPGGVDNFADAKSVPPTPAKPPKPKET